MHEWSESEEHFIHPGGSPQSEREQQVQHIALTKQTVYVVMYVCMYVCKHAEV